MKFQDWFDERVKVVYDVEELKKSNLNFIDTNIPIIKKIYNFYKNTSIIDILGIYKNETGTGREYLITLDGSIDVSGVFQNIKFLTINGILKNINKEYFINDCLMKRNVKINNNNFYCILTLNPYEYSNEYIKSVEKVLNENIDTYTNIDLLYDQFINELKTNSLFKAVLETTFLDFAIVCFKDKDEYKEFIMSSYSSQYELEVDAINDLIGLIENEDPKINFINTKEVDKSKLN